MSSWRGGAATAYAVAWDECATAAASVLDARLNCWVWWSTARPLWMSMAQAFESLDLPPP